MKEVDSDCSKYLKVLQLERTVSDKMKSISEIQIEREMFQVNSLSQLGFVITIAAADSNSQ